MGKQKWAVICSVIAILSIIGGILLYYYDQSVKEEQALKKEFMSRFHEVVQVTETTNLWKKQKDTYVSIGTVPQGTELYLKETPMNRKEDHYYKIEDSPYYIDYQKVEALQTLDQDETPYLPWNENVITKENYSLTRSDQSWQIQEVGIYPVIEKNQEYYKIKFQNRLFQIPLTEIDQVVEANHTDQTEAKTISILYFNGGKASEIESLLQNLKEQEIETISLEDYRLWQEERVRLPEKRVVLLFDNLSDSLIQFLTENEFQGVLIKETSEKWKIANEPSQPHSTGEIPIYQIDSTVTLETLEKMCKGEKVPLPSKETNPYATAIPVLNYHFFYNAEEGNRCGETICLPIQKFEEQLKYLKENGYKTLTMEEYRAWMYGEINLPRKSVLLTIDDGAMGTGERNGNLVAPMLEKYDMHATLFLITAWWKQEDYKTPHLEVESHGYDIHQKATCDGTSKARAVCLSKEELVWDLKQSINELGTKTAFCYPFYIYNDKIIESVQEAGFSLAFGGGGVKSKRTNHKYKIPRYIVYDDITMDQFVKMVS